MNHLVHFEPGQWVLAYTDGNGPFPGSGEMCRSLELLVHAGSGWALCRPSELFDILHVARVMPKTFTTIGEPSPRRYRDQVIAAASTEGELVALRDKLFAIGFEADHAIEEETARVMAEFSRKTRADALAKIHRALPHIFGRVG